MYRNQPYSRAIRPFTKLATAARLLRGKGATALVHETGRQLRPLGWRLRRWWYKDRDWLGRLVALSGNRLTVDGCRFELSHPLITNATRARMLRGRYERSERALLDAWLDRQSPVIELGGGLGVTATLINRRLHDPERHVVVEANPLLIPVLYKHRQLNGGRFAIRHGAISYSGESTPALAIGRDFLSARLGNSAPVCVAVPTLTLKDLVREYAYERVALVCDIEGTETDLVEHDGDVLRSHIATFIVEVHPEFRSAVERQNMFSALDRLGFARTANIRKVHVFQNTRLNG
jgi:FkbM family methyltransferase